MLLLLIFALMSILVFTALAIERILKDIRGQNGGHYFVIESAVKLFIRPFQTGL